MINEIDVYIQKVKYKHLGNQGVIGLNYDYDTGRFNPGAGCDLSNWLIPEVELKPIATEINMFEVNQNEPPF